MTELKIEWLKGKEHRRISNFNQIMVLLVVVFKPEKASFCFPIVLFVPPKSDP